MTREQFVTTTRGLDRDSFALTLFEKAKRFGVWNPSEIDFSADIIHWQSFSDLEKEVLLHLTTLFQGGEEAVTVDLLPLILTIAREGRLEEEMFLTTFLWEEAKHVDFFARFLEEIAGDMAQDLTRFSSPAYHILFHEKLPTALNALYDDPSPAAQVRASITYNMIVEGVLAETGYHAFYSALETQDIMPGVREGVGKLKQDESRHIAYGLHLLTRLISADKSLYTVAEQTMNDLLPLAMSVIQDIFARYPKMPFGLDLMTFSMYAMNQYQARLARIQAAAN